MNVLLSELTPAPMTDVGWDAIVGWDGVAGVSRSIAPCLRNGVRLPAHTPLIPAFQPLISAGLSREALYKALRPGSAPRFDTVNRVCTALGVRLVAKPARS
jgi:hypothetical protein